MIAEAGAPGHRSAPPRGGEERRAHVRLRRYWSGLGVAGALPALGAIDMSDPALNPGHLFLLKVDPAPFLSVFVYGGQQLSDFAGADPKGKRIVELLPESVRADLCGACAIAINGRRPVEAHGQVAGDDGRTICYRSAFFPLRDTQANECNYVIGSFGSHEADA